MRRISILPIPSGAAVVLGDDGNKNAPIISESDVVSTQKQTVYLPGSDSAVTFPRYNSQESMAWSVSRNFPSSAQAALWWAQHKIECPNYGHIMIETTSASGSQQSVIPFSHLNMSLKGDIASTIRISYSIVGQKPSLTIPS